MPDTKIRFKARLLQPESAAKGRPWAFLVLPMPASAKLPARGTVSVEGSINGHAFKALAAAPAARALWSQITPVARRDWIQWIISATQPGTRARRIRNACEMLAGGKKRVCCFDRSGFYSKGLSAPKVSESA